MEDASNEKELNSEPEVVRLSARGRGRGCQQLAVFSGPPMHVSARGGYDNLRIAQDGGLWGCQREGSPLCIA